MKAFTFFTAAFAALATAAPTSNIEERSSSGVSIQTFMSQLTSGSSSYTTEIQSLIGSLPTGATKKEKLAIAPQVTDLIQELTAFIQEAVAKIDAVGGTSGSTSSATSSLLAARAKTPKIKQPTLADINKQVLSQLDGKPLVLAKLLLPLLQELNPAVDSILNTLALEEVDAALQPLLKVELPALVTALSTLVQGLLVALAPLLAALGGILGPLLLGLGL